VQDMQVKGTAMRDKGEPKFLASTLLGDSRIGLAWLESRTASKLPNIARLLSTERVFPSRTRRTRTLIAQSPSGASLALTADDHLASI
jgi:hypothetical protein